MTSLVSFSNLVDGAAAPVSETFESYYPFTDKPWARIPRRKASDVDEGVSAAHKACRSGPWRTMTPSARGRLLMRLADLITANSDRLAALETRDSGKLVSDMTAQVRYIAEWHQYFGGLVDKIEGAGLPIDKAGMFAYTRRESVGVVAAIVRWNSPLLLLTWKLAPLLAVGNTVIIEPSEHASASTLAFAELFSEAGFPPGVVNTSISRNRRVRSASLTAANLMRLVSYLGGASNRPSSQWFATACASPRKRCSGPFCWSFHSMTRTKRSRSRTTVHMAWRPVSGLQYEEPSTAPSPSKPEPYGSTAIGPSATSRPSAATSGAASVAKADTRQSTRIFRPNPSGSIDWQDSQSVRHPTKRRMTKAAHSTSRRLGSRA
jgi:hypothetical protein